MTATTSTTTTAAALAAYAAASIDLTNAVESYGAAGAAALVKRYGVDVDLAAVKLARQAAIELAGGAKSKGGARANVLAVIATVANTLALHTAEVKGNDLAAVTAAVLTPAVFVTAARARLNENKATQQAYRDKVKGLNATLRDSTATVEARTAALLEVDAIDTATKADKRASAIKSLQSALDAAVKLGISPDVIHDLVHASLALDADMAAAA